MTKRSRVLYAIQQLLIKNLHQMLAASFYFIFGHHRAFSAPLLFWDLACAFVFHWTQSKQVESVGSPEDSHRAYDEFLGQFPLCFGYWIKVSTALAVFSLAFFSI